MTCLGRNVLEKLKDLVPPLLDLALTRRQEAPPEPSKAECDAFPPPPPPPFYP